MKNLTINSLISILEKYINENISIDEVRQFIFDYYENEQEFVLDNYLEEIFPILSSYFEYEEAYGDSECKDKLNRLYQVLEGKIFSIEAVVFALEFSKIKELTLKVNSKQINYKIYEKQIAKLFPFAFNTKKIIALAETHINENKIRLERFA